VLIPGSRLPDVSVIGFDKVVHFSLFVLWSTAVRFDLQTSFKTVTVALFGILFSILTELIQVFIEGRTVDAYDLIADFLGLAVGISLGKKALQLLGLLK
jgi:VanZ family protein